MKQVYALLISLFCYATSLIGQTVDYPNSFTYKVLGVDTYSPYLEQLHRFDKQTFGFSAEYNRYINRGLSLSLPFRLGEMNYPYDVQDFHKAWSFYAQDISLKYNFFTAPDKKIQPYISTGIGFMYIKKAEQKWETQLPVELGISVELMENIFLNLSTSYRLSTGAEAWHNGIGLQFLFDTKSDESPEIGFNENTKIDIVDIRTVEPNAEYYLMILDDHHSSILETADIDKDGVPDAIDLCPNEYGDETAGGCPIKDDDNDGMANFEDRCPTEAGTIEYGGCPDSDGDHIADIFDACPQEVGNRICKGCPDYDGDNIPDILDKCPTEKGSIDNEGCPNILMTGLALKGIQPIFFEIDSYALDTNGYNSLNTIIKMMNHYPNAALGISGIAYDSEDRVYNERLSIERAKECYKYLVSKGIAAERVTYQGLGNTRMIESGKLQKSVEFYMAL